MDGDAAALAGQVVDDRYRVERKIGAGGMGDVYLAHQLKIDRPVALKVLKPERVGDERAVAQFLTEAMAVSRLTSPHTVTLHDVGQLANGTPYLAMELLEGETLRARLASGPLSLAEAIDVVDAIALSLAEAHARGVVHRDLKPSNVFLALTPGHRCQVKVLDFGLARLAGDDTATRAAGTPRYMAPEALHAGEATARTDVYALALVAYELLARGHPFADLAQDALIEAQISDVPPLVDSACDHDLPPLATRLIARSLAKPARLRPRDAAEFRHQWRAAFGLPEEHDPRASPTDVVDHEPGPSQTVVSRTLTQLRPARAPNRLWAVAVVALVGATTWVFLNWRSEIPTISAQTVEPQASTTPIPSSTSEPKPVAVPVRPTAAPTMAISADATPRGEVPMPPHPRIVRAPAATKPAPAPEPEIPRVDERIDDYLDE